MSKARNIADLLDSNGDVQASSLDSQPQLGRRNLIINGGFDVWQRGTSGFTTSGAYTADRWWMYNATSVERSSDAPAGFTYSMKVNTTTSNTAIGQPIELSTGSSSPMSAGETVTLSFYAKTSTGTDYVGVTVNFRDFKFSGTNQSAFSDSGGRIVTTEWQRFSATFTVPTINSTNVLAGLEIFGIDADIYITGVQLELGSVATPFEHRSYGEELALCQRYYEAFTGNIDCYTHYGNDTTGAYAIERTGRKEFTQTMRTAPTMTLTGNALINGVSAHGFGLITPASSVNTVVYIISAYTASAEL